MQTQPEPPARVALGPPERGAPLELWGGLECTVNRVGDDYLDQIAASGHDHRPDDLDRIAALGVRALRYPVLWERTAPDGVADADWAWSDARLGRLRALGVRPIVGLVHHGSGPRHTSLVDPGFAAGLAAYARAVAERYPWVDAYTPVNEPLTTARFAGLYGHWYPHGRDERTFARALLTQCRAVALAMRAVRAVNPAARLVQTDDLGKTYSTPRLAYQAAFDNERRWLTWDLLGGRVVPGHPLWWHLTRRAGVPEGELAWFAERPCPPDVVGVNTYVTSERFLDHRTGRYPPATRGGNRKEAYADVEAVRVLAGGIAGPGALLREAWERYRRPVAVTEAHLGATREEQLRWLLEVWRGAQDARAAGAEVAAVTVWSLLGAYDWDSLVTRRRGHYEPGVFDLRGPAPRPTALARLLPELAAGAAPSHPALDGPGWWRRNLRLLYPPVRRCWPAPPNGRGTPASPALSAPPRGAFEQPAAPVLLVGEGTLARAVARQCAERGLVARPVPGAAAAGPREAAALLARLRPWAVVDAAGSAAGGRSDLAAACAGRGVPLVTFRPHELPDSPAAPADPAAAVAGPGRDRLLVRHGPLFDPWDAADPVAVALCRLAAGRTALLPDAPVAAPTHVPDLVDAALDLLLDGERGEWQLTTADRASLLDLVRGAAARAGIDVAGLKGRPPTGPAGAAPAADAGAGGAPRRGAGHLPPLTAALDRFVRELRLADAMRPTGAGAARAGRPARQAPVRRRDSPPPVRPGEAAA